MLARCTHRHSLALPLCPAGLHTLFKGLKSNPGGVELCGGELGQKASEERGSAFGSVAEGVGGKSVEV